jgi:hypothetical protein
MVQKHFRVPILFGSLLLLTLMVNTAFAGLGVGVTFTPACDGYTLRGGSITANRDNTGRGKEAYVTSARDGSGRVLYDSETTYPINRRVVYGDGDHVNWTHLPQYNPIIMEVLSPGGNGQADQVIYLVTGNCATLPTYGSGVFALGDNLSLMPIFAPADGRTSNPYDPNANPPRPVNPPGLAESLPGYAVVATDNLFLRNGAGAEFAPVGILDGGTKLIVLGQNGALGDALWWYVEVGGMRGWVKSSLLYLRGDLTDVPVVPNDGSLTQPTLYVGAQNPIYETAAASSRWLCEIDGNRLYNVVAQDAKTAGWYRIETTCDGQPVLGWIQAASGLLRNPGGVDIPVA